MTQEQPSGLPGGKTWLKGLIGRFTVASVTAILSLVVFARFSAEFGEQGGRLPRVDHEILNYFREHRIGWLFQVAHAVSWAFRPTGMVVIGAALAVLFFVNHRRDAAATLLFGAVGGSAVVTALKIAFGRPRPEEIFAPLGYSFPSGHTFMAVTILGITSYFLARESPPGRRPWIWGTSVFVMALVGWSRMYLGEHFPSDVGAGYSGALCWIWVCLYISSFFWHNTAPSERSKSAGTDTAPATHF